MLLEEAQLIADEVYNELYPFCERIMIAGSIRRKKPNVGDIEIVCIPKRGQQNSRKTGKPAPIMGYIQTVQQWVKIKGEPWDKYTQRFVHPKGDDNLNKTIKLDIFTADVDNWGYILAIRTGSAEYSHKVLATGWVRAGYRGQDGYLVKPETKNSAIVEIIPVREEEDLFKLIGINYEKPEERNL